MGKDAIKKEQAIKELQDFYNDYNEEEYTGDISMLYPNIIKGIRKGRVVLNDGQFEITLRYAIENIDKLKIFELTVGDLRLAMECKSEFEILQKVLLKCNKGIVPAKLDEVRQSDFMVLSEAASFFMGAGNIEKKQEN